MTDPVVGSRIRGGGRAALAGFLVQFVATIGFAADAALPLGHATPGDDEGEVLLRAVRATGLIPELADADAVALGIEPTDETIVVQVKYTGAAQPADIGPAELRQICESLAGQMVVLERETNRATNKAFLVTNRELSADAQHHKERCDANRGDPPSDWSVDGWGALKKLLVRPGPGLEDWSRSVDHLGSLLGATSEETRAAARTLVGDTLLAVARGEACAITARSIVGAITGVSDALPLTSERVSAVSATMVSEFFELAMLAPRAQHFATRDLLAEIDRAATSAAFVVVVGPGGDGKTVGVAQWLQRRTRHGVRRGEVFGGIGHAKTIHSGWVRSLFRRWVNVHGGLDSWPRPLAVIDVVERTALAAAALELRRFPERLAVERALSEAGPLFTLVIDGVDEVEDRQAIDPILEWFGREQERIGGPVGRSARALLVVTCRHDRDLRDLFAPRIAGIVSDLPRPYVIVRAGVFTRDELFEAAESLSGRVAGRLRQSFAAADPADVGSGLRPGILNRRRDGKGSTPSSANRFDVIGAASPEFAPAAFEIGNSLLHPAMWGVFGAIQEEELRDSILDGRTDAVLRLAADFLRWALAKCMQRHPGARREASELVSHLISTGEIARALNQGPAQLPLDLWRRGFEPGLHHSIGATQFAKELESSGVIQIDDGSTWGWRHSFLSDVFASETAKQSLRAWASDQ